MQSFQQLHNHPVAASAQNDIIKFVGAGNSLEGVARFISRLKFLQRLLHIFNVVLRGAICEKFGCMALYRARAS